MSTSLDPHLVAVASPTPVARRCGVHLDGEAFIPDWICDLDSFRRWTDSQDYPMRGRYSFLQGQLWVDLGMEQLFTHNQVKTELTIEFGRLIRDSGSGYFFSDGVRLSHPLADLSSEPDAVFVSFESIRQGKVKLVRGQLGGYVELEGSPEWVVEIVSSSSVTKDTKLLRDLYAKAGVMEYWLIDARSQTPSMEILNLTEGSYRSGSRTDAGYPSRVLSRNIELIQESDPLGNPRYQFRITNTHV